MPTIAQQDYLRPQGKHTNSDCHLLAALAHNLLQGTLFDTIMVIDYAGEVDEARPIATDGRNVYFYDAMNGEIAQMGVEFTQTQYEGLAAIQDAADDYTGIPGLGADNDTNLLAETVLGLGAIGVGGKILEATVADGVLVGLSISEQSYPDVEITWEDAQKLIGLPIS